MKLTSRRLKAALRARWAVVIEEDANTEGFWDEVEHVLGVRPAYEMERAICDWVNEYADRVRHGGRERPQR